MLQIANIDFFPSFVKKKKKIAPLLKIPFLDEGPGNSFPRKVCGMFIQLQFK